VIHLLESNTTGATSPSRWDAHYINTAAEGHSAGGVGDARQWILPGNNWLGQDGREAPMERWRPRALARGAGRLSPRGSRLCVLLLGGVQNWRASRSAWRRGTSDRQTTSTTTPRRGTSPWLQPPPPPPPLDPVGEASGVNTRTGALRVEDLNPACSVRAPGWSQLALLRYLNGLKLPLREVVEAGGRQSGALLRWT